MKVKEILINVTKLMEINNVYDYLTNDNIALDDSIMADIDRLLSAVNMTNSIIASQYIEVNDCVEIQSKNNLIHYADITDKNIIEIKEVTDYNGSPIEYKLCSDGIEVSRSKVNVKFSYFPSMVDIDDDINYYTKINTITFAFGVIAEYLFLKGDFEDSYIWDNKFKQSLSSLVRPKRKIVMPTKRWL